MKASSILKLIAVVTLGTGLMYGQATRTWVSGVGDDANPCSRTAPCKTFAGAISKTAAGGEIDALDPAGFGALTITKAITIDGGGGIVASVLVSGTNGIVVQAGANDVVTLRNLMFNGISSGLNGIRFLSGKELNIETWRRGKTVKHNRPHPPYILIGYLHGHTRTQAGHPFIGELAEIRLAPIEHQR